MGEKEEALLNSRQAAEILDLSPDTVNELARKKTLPGTKRGRQWRFRQRDIASFKKKLQERVAA
jgi:excisionase family DNA binding protein